MKRIYNKNDLPDKNTRKANVLRWIESELKQDRTPSAKEIAAKLRVHAIGDSRNNATNHLSQARLNIALIKHLSWLQRNGSADEVSQLQALIALFQATGTYYCGLGSTIPKLQDDPVRMEKAVSKLNEMIPYANNRDTVVNCFNAWFYHTFPHIVIDNKSAHAYFESILCGVLRNSGKVLFSVPEAYITQHLKLDVYSITGTNKAIGWEFKVKQNDYDKLFSRKRTDIEKQRKLLEYAAYCNKLFLVVTDNILVKETEKQLLKEWGVGLIRLTSDMQIEMMHDAGENHILEVSSAVINNLFLIYVTKCLSRHIDNSSFYDMIGELKEICKHLPQ